jgi:hypothetical protein
LDSERFIITPTVKKTMPRNKNIYDVNSLIGYKYRSKSFLTQAEVA